MLYHLFPSGLSTGIVFNSKSNIQSLEDFIVDDGIESSFLEDNIGDNANHEMPIPTHDDDDSDRSEKTKNAGIEGPSLARPEAQPARPED